MKFPNLPTMHPRIILEEHYQASPLADLPHNIAYYTGFPISQGQAARLELPVHRRHGRRSSVSPGDLTVPELGTQNSVVQQIRPSQQP